MIEKQICFTATKRKGEVSALLLRPQNAHRLMVFAHGAGAGLRHAFMENTARKLAGHEIATFRYNFPYMEAGRKAPDPQQVLLDTVRAADLDLLRPLCHRLQSHGKVTLHAVDGADHGFHVPKTSGRTDEDVLEELVKVVTQCSLPMVVLK